MNQSIVRGHGVKVAAGLLAAGLALTACSSSSKSSGSGGSSGGSSGAAGGNVPGADALANAAGVTEVTFWHSMTGNNAKAVDQVVSDFNASQTKVHVTATFKGNYDDTIAAYKTAVKNKQTPSIAQIYDVGTRFMVDSKQTLPVADFAAKDGYSLGDLQPNIVNYYTVDDKLQSMPFNSSVPLLYINVEAFKLAGLDPANPPKTLDELTAAAEKLTIKNPDGTTKQYGFGAAIYGWFVEQFTAESGALYCDNGNGRQSKATTLNLTSGAPLDLTTWWVDMVKKGYALNTGRTTTDAQAAFKGAKVAMNVESTGVLGGYVAAGSAASSKFTVATAPFPKIKAGDSGGPVIGGASLWIDGPGHSPAEQRGAWEFAKFASSAAEQAKWHIATGYFPVNTKTLDDPADVKYRDAHPQFQTAVDQMKATQPTPATAGCLLGVMPQARATLEGDIQNAITGSGSPADDLADATTKIQKLIKDYNEAVGG